jgi:hypothetical protein
MAVRKAVRRRKRPVDAESPGYTRRAKRDVTRLDTVDDEA